MSGSQGDRVIANAAQCGFKVGYEIKECQYGLGLFATEDIPKGAMIWNFNPPGNVRTFKNAEEISDHLSKLSPEEATFFMGHVYMFDGLVNEILDDGCYWNHSDTPNTGNSADCESSYAIRDIKAGEELLDDYGTYEYPAWLMAVFDKYGIPQNYFDIKTKSHSDAQTPSEA